jgi:aspartate aminotransferase-like enzyme
MDNLFKNMTDNMLDVFDETLNFTIGPVQMYPSSLELGSKQIPYFRNREFSEIYFENERLMHKFLHAESGAKAVFMTGSGSASMEAAVMNIFTDRDNVLVVNGGTFGERFAEICQIHAVPHTEIKLNYGEPLTAQDLMPYENKGYTGLLVNLHETSTGVLYDIDLLSDFAVRNRLFLVVDAISAFLAEDIDMDKHCIDAVIIGSQKALALPPGVSVISLSARAVERVMDNRVKSLYFNLASYLKNGERGQTPFTPAVGTLIQLNDRLRRIDAVGCETEIDKVRSIAAYFRKRIEPLPLRIFAKTPSCAITSLSCLSGNSAQTVCDILKADYKLFVCPNGGELQHRIFRVGHIGNICKNDIDRLIDALNDMERRQLL